MCYCDFGIQESHPINCVLYASNFIIGVSFDFMITCLKWAVYVKLIVILNLCLSIYVGATSWKGSDHTWTGKEIGGQRERAACYQVR